MNRSQETRLKKLEAKLEQARSARARRYVFHPDEVAEAEAQGLPYVLVPRVCSSSREWMERYGEQPAAEASRIWRRLKVGGNKGASWQAERITDSVLHALIDCATAVGGLV